MGELGNYYWWEYQRGNRDVIGALGAEEANLLHARQLARTNGWWDALTSAMQGLRQLYDHTGRRAEWAALVIEIVPDFVDPATDGPRAGREEQWSLVTEYRVRLAMEARQWEQAERLQRVCVEWDRQRAAPALAALGGGVQLNAPTDAQRNAIRTLAVSLGQLSDIQREQGKKECAKTSEEAIAFYQRIGDRAAEAVAAFNLGRAYTELPALRDLAQAERWYRRILDLVNESDRLGRGKATYALGHVAYERFKEAREADDAGTGGVTPPLQHLNDAAQFYQQALDLLPPDAVDDLAVTHNQLGNIYNSAGDIDRALQHYREAIRYWEGAGDLYNAANARFNVAVALAQAGRLVDAREYALAALRNYETFGDRAADKIEKTRGLVAWIEERMRGG